MKVLSTKTNTSAECMKFLGISKATLLRRVKNREIPFTRGDGKRSRLYFYKSQINDYIEKQRVKTKLEIKDESENYLKGDK